MDLEILGQQCKKYSHTPTCKKRSVHISLFVGENTMNSRTKQTRPKSSVMYYVQRKPNTPISRAESPKEHIKNLIYMPKLLSKTPSPKKNRFFSSKNKTKSFQNNEPKIPAQLAIESLLFTRSNMSKALNLSLKVDKLQIFPNRLCRKPNTPKLKIADFEDRFNSFLKSLKK